MSTGHLDDSTGAAWRRAVILVLLFFQSSSGAGWNFLHSWNSGTVTYIRKCHQSLNPTVVGNKYVKYLFWVSYTFKFFFHLVNDAVLI